METVSWEMGNWLVSTALTDAFYQVQHNEPTCDDTVQKLIFIMLKRPKSSFAMIILDPIGLLSAVSASTQHLSYLYPSFFV